MDEVYKGFMHKNWVELDVEERQGSYSFIDKKKKLYK